MCMSDPAQHRGSKKQRLVAGFACNGTEHRCLDDSPRTTSYACSLHRQWEKFEQLRFFSPPVGQARRSTMKALRAPNVARSKRWNAKRAFEYALGGAAGLPPPRCTAVCSRSGREHHLRSSRRQFSLCRAGSNRMMVAWSGHSLHTDGQHVTGYRVHGSHLLRSRSAHSRAHVESGYRALLHGTEPRILGDGANSCFAQRTEQTRPSLKAIQSGIQFQLSTLQLPC